MIAPSHNLAPARWKRAVSRFLISRGFTHDEWQRTTIGVHHASLVAAVQQMLVQLGALAHNVLVWAKGWLVPAAPRLAKYGVQRLVRDVMGILGRVELDGEGQVQRIVLTEASPLARQVVAAFQQLGASVGFAVILGPT